jgi:murein DD-endopeptidase MepM/ murein hydrolase activator NlpD
VLTTFELHRAKLFLYGRPARVVLRVNARARQVRARLVLRRPGERSAVAVIPLGVIRTRTTLSVPLTGREDGILPQGRYELVVSARDSRGRHLRRARSVPRVRELRFYHHRFPLVGPFSYGGPGARFGAPRRGHRHQGQDLPAAEGTPVVTPRGGTIKAVQYQAGGAGHYVVMDGRDEDRDYVFMHLRTGSVRVHPGQSVRTGQRIGDVGSTGGSSAPHLHFEVWVGGGWFSGGHPTDPMPLLRVWDRWS